MSYTREMSYQNGRSKLFPSNFGRITKDEIYQETICQWNKIERWPMGICWASNIYRTTYLNVSGVFMSAIKSYENATW